MTDNVHWNETYNRSREGTKSFESMDLKESMQDRTINKIRRRTVIGAIVILLVVLSQIATSVVVGLYISKFASSKESSSDSGVIGQQQDELMTAQIDLLRRDLDSLNDSVVAAREQLDDQTAQADSFRRELATLNDTFQNPLVVFKAKDATVEFLSYLDVIIFPSVLINEGSGYDSKTGIFTAPVHGLYLFTVHFCLYRDKYLVIRLMADNEIITISQFVQDTYSAVCHSSNGFAILPKGGEVKVIMYDKTKGPVIYPDSLRNLHWTTFSGALVQTLE